MKTMKAMRAMKATGNTQTGGQHCLPKKKKRCQTTKRLRAIDHDIAKATYLNTDGAISSVIKVNEEKKKVIRRKRSRCCKKARAIENKKAVVAREFGAKAKSESAPKKSVGQVLHEIGMSHLRGCADSEILEDPDI